MDINFTLHMVEACKDLKMEILLVSMGSAGIMYEITEDHEVVWRWVCPYRVNSEQNFAIKNYIYQGFRYPYSYLSREKPIEISVDQNEIREGNTCTRVKETFVEGVVIQNDIDFMTMAMENEDEIALQREIISMESSKVKFISTENFDKRIAENPTSIVIFGGKSCVHCKSVREIVIELIEEEFGEIVMILLGHR